MPPDISWWLCCLNSGERSVLRSTVEALALTLWVGIPFDLWDAFWTGVPYSGDARRIAFLHIYRLETIEVVDVETDLEVLLVRPLDAVLYAEWVVYLLTPDAACLSGCEQSQMPPP